MRKRTNDRTDMAEAAGIYRKTDLLGIYCLFTARVVAILLYADLPYCIIPCRPIVRVLKRVQSVAYREGVWGVQPPPPHPPKFRSFDKAAFDCKLSGKCLVFLFQHPN